MSNISLCVFVCVCICVLATELAKALVQNEWSRTLS